MLTRLVDLSDARYSGARWLTAAMACLLLTAAPLHAQAPTLPPVTVGGGVQTSFLHSDTEGVDDATDEFVLNSVRLYVNGNAAKKIKFEFNTEYSGSTNTVIVLDAVAKFEVSNAFNIWMGRMLPPSDRANLYGPYFSHHWAAFQDGVQDGYPFVAAGRDNGFAYWGQFSKIKVSAGAFDGSSAHTGEDTLISAGRFQIDFWDPEPGYYLNGSYYGEKKLLAIGVAGQAQGSDKGAYNVDFLLETKNTGSGSFAIEAEWAKYDGLGGYDANYGTNDGGYVLGSYLFPPMMNMNGKFELLGKFANARFRDGKKPVDADYDQKTTEVNFNYIINDFKARVMLFYKDTRFSAVRPNNKQVGVGVQLQM